jgi:hypothetical protein
MEMMGESGICGLLQLSGDEFSFLFTHRKPKRRCKGGACVLALPAPGLKVAVRQMKGEKVLHNRLCAKRLKNLQSGFGPLIHGNRNGAVDLDHRGGRNLKEGIMVSPERRPVRGPEIRSRRRFPCFRYGERRSR